MNTTHNVIMNVKRAKPRRSKIFFICITGPEYGTMEAAWKAVLVESDRRCDLHNRVKEDMQMKVNNQLKLWQRENYHKVTRYFVYLINGH